MKYKKQFELTFSAIFQMPRPVFFAEIPHMGSGEVAEVVKKEAEGPELDVAGMLVQVNSEFDKYKSQLEELPPAFSNMLHDEIVRYMRASPGRFEKDDKAGLSSAEFQAYREAMISKVQALLKEYAPTEEDLKQIREAKAKSKEAQKAAEQLEPIKDVTAIEESPGEISDPGALQESYARYDSWNISLQQEASAVLTAGGAVQTAYASFKKARDGLSSYKKFTSYLMPENDTERIELQDKIRDAKKKVEETVKKYRDAKARIDKYASGLAEASNKIKEEKMKERDGHMRARDDKIAEMEKRAGESEESRKQNETAYARIEKQRESLEKKRDGLEQYREKTAKGKELSIKKKDEAEKKNGQLSACEGTMRGAISAIEEALQNPDLDDDARAQLEETKRQLEGKAFEVACGVDASQLAAEGAANSIGEFVDSEKAAAEKSLNLKTHLAEQVDPALKTLNHSIFRLSETKLKYATTREQVDSHYDMLFKGYDGLFSDLDACDEAIDGAILKNNLANEQMISSLEAQQKSIGSMDVAPPSGWTAPFEATAGVVLGTVFGAAQWAGEFLMEQATALSEGAADLMKEDWAQTFWGAPLAADLRVIAEIINLPIGFTAGLVEMGGGIVGIFAHPIQAGQGIGALFGANPDISAGTALKEMGKAIISYEDFSHGRIGVGIGKIFANAAATIATGGAAGGAAKGGQAASLTGRAAARAAYVAARSEGVGVMRSLGRATAASARGTGRAVAADVNKGLVAPVKGAVRTAKKGVTVVTEAGVTGIAKGAADAGRRGISAVRGISARGVGGGVLRGAKSAVNYAKSLVERSAAQTERLWGGTKLRNVRLNNVLRTLALRESKIVDDIGRGAERYDEFMAAMNKLADENPGMTESALRLKLSETNANLLADGYTFERNLKKLDDVRNAVDDAVVKSVKDPGRRESVRWHHKNRDADAVRMGENTQSYNDFQKLVEESDPLAVEARDFMNMALESDDPLLYLRQGRNKFPNFQAAFDFMEARTKHDGNLRNIALIQLRDSITDKLSRMETVFTKDVQKILDEAVKGFPDLPRNKGQVMFSLNNNVKVVLDGNGRLHAVKSAPRTFNYDSWYAIYRRGERPGTVMEIADFHSMVEDGIRTKMIDPHSLDTVVHEGLFTVNENVISAIEKAYGGQGLYTLIYSTDLPLSAAQRLKVAQHLLDEFRYKNLIDMHMEGKINLTNPSLRKRLHRLDDTSARAKDATGLTLSHEIRLLTGRVKLNDAVIGKLMSGNDEAVNFLEHLLKDSRTKIDSRLANAETLLKKIKLRRELKEDIGAMKAMRMVMSKDSFARSAEEVINKLRAGITVQDSDLGIMFMRLRERDPAVYKLILESDVTRLASSECLDSLFFGEALEIVDARTSGLRRFYVGKEINRGGMSTVSHGVFIGNDGKLHYVAVRKAQPGQEGYFLTDIDGAETMVGWDFTHLNRPLAWNDTVMILETGENALDMWRYIKSVPNAPAEVMDMMKGAMRGTIEYLKNGRVHADLKLGNILTYIDGNGQRVVKIIDHTPATFDQIAKGISGDGLPATPGHHFIKAEMEALENRLAASGLRGDDLIETMARAQQMKAWHGMLQDVLNRMVPKWKDDTYFTRLLDSLNDGAVSGRPGFVERFLDELDVCKQRMESYFVPHKDPLPAHPPLPDSFENAPTLNRIPLEESPTVKAPPIEEAPTLPRAEVIENADTAVPPSHKAPTDRADTPTFESDPDPTDKI